MLHLGGKITNQLISTETPNFQFLSLSPSIWTSRPETGSYHTITLMPPRKKPLSSSTTSAKKSNSKVQPQPSKFGIQHFFERHTQNSQNPKIAAVSASQQNLKPLAAPASSTVAPAQSVPEIQNPAHIDTGNAVLASGSHEIRSNFLSSSNNSMSQNTPPENLRAVGVVGEEENMEDEASPEISKSKSFKRFKFSPGMVKF